MPKSGSEVIHIYHKSACDLAKQLRALREGAEVVPIALPSNADAPLDDVEILLVGGALPKWSEASKLKFVQVMGVGVDHLGGFAGLDGAVPVATLRGVFAPSVAEHALAMLLALHRGIPSHLASQRERRWCPFPSRPLAGQSAVVLGLGEVGKRIARALAALDITVTGVCRTARDVDGVETVYGADELASAIAGAGIVISALPLTEATRGLIGEAALATLAEHALVVNVGRGEIFDETALVNAVESGHLGGVGLDTFAVEPLLDDSPLWQLPNSILSPHVGGWIPEYDDRCLERLCSNLDSLASGDALVGLVDRDAGY